MKTPNSSTEEFFGLINEAAFKLSFYKWSPGSRCLTPRALNLSTGKKSQYKGVYSTKSKTKGVRWHAIFQHHKCCYLGTFETEEDAARAWDLAAKHAYGEFAQLNFPDSTPKPETISCDIKEAKKLLRQVKSVVTGGPS
jgi:hypothetical protein